MQIVIESTLLNQYKYTRIDPRARTRASNIDTNGATTFEMCHKVQHAIAWGGGHSTMGDDGKRNETHLLHLRQRLGWGLDASFSH